MLKPYIKLKRYLRYLNTGNPVFFKKDDIIIFKK